MAAVKKVLVVDDEQALARALEIKLKSKGLEVEVAHDGEEAIEKYKNNSFALILLDLIMPKLDGFAVLKNLQLANNTTPIIVLSNLGQDEDAAKARALGAKDYFVKSNMPINEIVKFVKGEI